MYFTGFLSVSIKFTFVSEFTIIMQNAHSKSCLDHFQCAFVSLELPPIYHISVLNYSALIFSIVNYAP